MKFSFLPYTETDIASDAQAPTDPGKQRLYLDYNLEVHKGLTNTGSLSFGTELRGPGDIIGIDRAMISRIEPARGLRAFEPNYFPHIEFKAADFPWRYSLDTSDHQRKPWLVLIVLKADEFEFLDSEQSPLSKIRVNDPEVSLPPLAQSWAYAHTHIGYPEDGNTDLDGLAEDSDWACSRLLCPRRLKGQESYYAFLVPSYESGRLAGLGLKSSGHIYDQPAWPSPDPLADGLTLPVYFNWRFVTDGGEDVEVLLRRLKGVDTNALQADLGTPLASAQTPGYYVGYVAPPGQSFEIQSAMQILDSSSPSQNTASLETDIDLAEKMKDTLDQVIEGEQDLWEDGDNDPLLAFSPYGFRYKPETEVSIAKANNNEWFDRINLDLKYRYAAGIGARVVQKYQEEISHICWTQYGDIIEANEKLARLQIAGELANSLVEKHFTKLPEAVAISLSEPLHNFVKTSSGKTIAQTLTDNGAPRSFASRALRRQSSKRTMPEHAVDPAVTTTSGRVPMPGIPVPGDIGTAPAQLAPGQIQMQTARVQMQAIPSPLIAQKGLEASVQAEYDGLVEPLTFAQTKRPKITKAKVLATSPAELSQPLATTYTSLPRTKAIMTVAGLTEAELTDEIKPIWRSPEVPVPTVNLLKEVNAQALIAGSDKIPNNSISLFEENRAFIEAFLVGMNHEMNNELRWREFPTDMRGTIFKRFWGKGLDMNDPSGDDIDSIHKWRGKLGTHVSEDAVNIDPSLIILIKGDIIRKLGNPIIKLRISGTDGEPLTDNPDDYPPQFMGKVGPDTSYFGFDISESTVRSNLNQAYFIIYEPAGSFRFGLDVGTANIRKERQDGSQTSYGFPMEALEANAFRPSYMQTGGSQSSPNPPAGPPTNTDDLSWSDMYLYNSGYIDFAQTNISTLTEWSGQKSSDRLARSFWQKPVAGILPLSRVIV